jgi:hypothetical protein
MGSEANYLTILNVLPQTNEVGLSQSDVMARTKDFRVRSLIISPKGTDNGAYHTLVDVAKESILASYLLAISHP